MLVHWLWLSTRTGLSDRVKVSILERYGDPEDLYYAGPESLKRIEGISEEGFAALCDKDLRPAQKILAQCTDGDIHLLTYGDEAYPRRLKNIPDPPLVLYYKGTLPDFDGAPVIGAVGTRQATSYGINVAERLGYQIGRCGGVLVSGMAKGIDAAVTRGALRAGAMVIGVLGSGADVVYPAMNRPLFAEVEARGCLICEHPPQTPPNSWNFPRRNRIISGLSNGVLVVEAPHQSGALITARAALEQGRDVFVVPGNIDVPACQGSNALLRDGAVPIGSGWDIMQEYEGQYPGKVRRFDGSIKPAAEPEQTVLLVAQEVQKPTVKPRKKKKGIDNGGRTSYIVEKPALALSAGEQAIVEKLKAGRCLADDVIAAVSGPAGDTLAVLTMLEVKGVIRRLPGNMLELK